MAITVTAGATATYNTVTAGWTPFTSVAVNAGDTLIFCVSISGSIAASAGYPTWNGIQMTLLGQSTGSTYAWPRIYGYYATANGTGNIVDWFTATKNYMAASYYKASGLNPNLVVNASGQAVANTTTVTASAATTKDNLLLIGAIAQRYSLTGTVGTLNGTCTDNRLRGGTPTGTTSSQTNHSATNIQTASGTKTMAASGLTSSRLSAVIVGLEASAAATSTVTGSEDITIADQPLVKSIIKTFSENISINDYIEKFTPKTLPSETVTLTDTLTANKIIIKTFDETITLEAIPSKRLSRAFDENITLTETFAKAASLKKAFDETLNLTETLIKGQFRRLSETISLTDTFIKTVGKSLSETFTLADTLTKRTAKNILETVTLTDTITKSIIKSFSESVSLTDTLSRILTLLRTFNETYTVEDQTVGVQKIGGGPTEQELNDVVTLTEEILKTIGITLQARCTKGM